MYIEIQLTYFALIAPVQYGDKTETFYNVADAVHRAHNLCYANNPPKVEIRLNPLDDFREVSIGHFV